MNKLDRDTRAKILELLCEGMSIRAITRVLGVSKNTVARLLVDAGVVDDSAAADFVLVDDGDAVNACTGLTAIQSIRLDPAAANADLTVTL